MTCLYLLLLAAGALPMTAFLLKRRRYYRILQKGSKTTARVTERKTVRYRGNGTHERVVYTFLPAGGAQYKQGDFISKIGKHRRGDLLDIYYLPQAPQQSAVPGSKGGTVMFIFTVLIFVFVVFACFKIHETVKNNVSYGVRLPWQP